MSGRVDTAKWINNISKDPKDAEEEYDRISACYDTDTNAKGYMAPRYVGEILANYVPDKKGMILDVGCGTGLVGSELNCHGFSNITGIDISANILKEAESKKVYAQTMKHNLLEPFPFEKSSFEAVVCAGVFSRFDESEINDILNEFSKVTRDEGFMVFTHREDLINPLLIEKIEEREEMRIESITDPLPYFLMDENYKDIYIRCFVLQKHTSNGD
ncbi:MAG: class I SAM-dependent methyltransferase [Desulfobacterales bacterium]|nr:class I SAM-dependent methyltransferase [Desulfobacterales bacterium]